MVQVDERQADRLNYAGVRYFAGTCETAAEEIRFVFTRDETKRETLNRRSTRSRQLITRGCGTRKARVNVIRTIKITKGCSLCVYVGGWKSVSSR